MLSYAILQNFMLCSCVVHGLNHACITVSSIITVGKECQWYFYKIKDNSKNHGNYYEILFNKKITLIWDPIEQKFSFYFCYADCLIYNRS